MSALKHKLLLLASILITACAFAFAQSAEKPMVIQKIEESGLITVNIPDGLVPILNHSETAAPTPTTHETAEAPKPATSKVGYRVQVFDDNNVRTAKAQAQERKHMIESRFPEFAAYVSFNSPYWRVKVGDFRTRSEAEAAMGAIRSAFPAIGSQLRVVRDKINPRY